MSHFLILANKLQELIDPATHIEAKDVADDKILAWLEERVQLLLDRNSQSLIQILYRVDINENELRTAIENSPPSNSAKIISKMILEREKSKLKTRDAYKRFRGSEEESDPERW